MKQLESLHNKFMGFIISAYSKGNWIP